MKEMKNQTDGNKVAGKNVYIYREPARYWKSEGSCNNGLTVIKLC